MLLMTRDDASMVERYVTYTDDEHVGNHDSDDNTADGHDNSNAAIVSDGSMCRFGPSHSRTSGGRQPLAPPQ